MNLAALSFLSPLAFLGALAVAAPVWLHLRRRPETNVLRFSAVRFLDDEPRPREAPRQLRDVLLLLLRVLGLLALLVAFAWPFLAEVSREAVRESRVYILDATLSHRAGGGFERDRRRLLAELGNVPSGVQTAVVALAASPRVVVPFGRDPEPARAALRELAPSYQRGSYLAAFRQAAFLLDSAPGGRKRIVLLGDSQENQWTETAATPPFLEAVELELPRPTAIAAFRPGGPWEGAFGAAAPNVSVSEPVARRLFLGDRSVVDLDFQLSHQGAASAATVILTVDGREEMRREVPLEGLPPSLHLRTQWESDGAGWVRGEVSVTARPDALPEDDRAFFAVPPVTEGRVAVLAGSRYLRLALSPEVMRGQWAARFLSPARLAEEVRAADNADVLCLESEYLPSADARALVDRYLASGRGVVLLVNRITPLVAGSLSDLGFEPMSASTAAAGELHHVVASHPVFRPFLSPDFGDLSEVSVRRYVPLRAANATPLLFARGGQPLFFESSRFGGKLYVAAFGLDREHTSWPVHPTFIPFLDLLLQNARPGDPLPLALEPEDLYTASVEAGARASAREAVVTGDDGVVLRSPLSGGAIRFRAPARPGLYTVTLDAGTRPTAVFAVNPPARESRLTYLDSPQAVAPWLVPVARPAAPVASSAPADAAGAAANVTRDQALRQLLWWGALLLALALLALETAWTSLREATR